MLRLFALATLAVNPPAYLLMKGMAVARHKAFNRVIEGGDGNLKDTWHEDLLDWVYPI